jgi:hypothetical protein
MAIEEPRWRFGNQPATYWWVVESKRKGLIARNEYLTLTF